MGKPKINAHMADTGQHPVAVDDSGAVQVNGYTLMDNSGKIPAERLDGIPGKTDFGGFAAGEQSSANEGGAIGLNASADTGGAVGQLASAGNGGAVGSEANVAEGGAVGADAKAEDGGAVGKEAIAGAGGAIGMKASTTRGAAVGSNAASTGGGAIGGSSKAGVGFSGGQGAMAGTDDNGAYIDTIQLGAGTNNNPKTLQVYNYTLMDAEGNIPAERLANAPSGGSDVKKQNEWIATTEGDGANYTVTLDPAPTELYPGMKITIIPHIGCTSVLAKLNVNELGAKTIRTAGVRGGENRPMAPSQMMMAEKPTELMYDGQYWVITSVGPPKLEKSLDSTLENSALAACAGKTLKDYIDETGGILEGMVNEKADKSVVATGMLTAAGWAGDGKPYTQVLEVPGLTAGQNGIIAVAQSATYEQREAARDALLTVTNQADGALTVSADGKKPEIDIPIVVTLIG